MFNDKYAKKKKKDNSSNILTYEYFIKWFSIEEYGPYKINRNKEAITSFVVWIT